MKKNKFHYVYRITNNINGRYYIGKHSSEWIDEWYYGSGLAIQEAIKKYGKENFTKEIIMYCETSEQAYSVEEAILTEEMVKSDECYNMTLGGDRVGLGETHPCLGTKISDTHKAAISRATKGRKSPMAGRKHSEDTKRRMKEKALKNGTFRKTVLQYNLAGEFIKEYISITEAAEKTGSHAASISLCCSGKQKTANKSKWKLKQLN